MLILLILCNFNIGTCSAIISITALLQDPLPRTTFSPAISNINTVLAQRVTINFNERIMQSYNAGQNLN